MSGFRTFGEMCEDPQLTKNNEVHGATMGVMVGTKKWDDHET